MKGMHKILLLSLLAVFCSVSAVYANYPANAPGAGATTLAGNATFESLMSIGDVGPGANQVAAGNHDHALDDLSDVNASAPLDGQGLGWNATLGAWTPLSFTGGGTFSGDADTLDGLDSTDFAMANATANITGVPGLSADITVTVGAGGDNATINAALEYLSGFYPLYKADGVTATINLLTGFTMAEQVIADGIDLGWIRIEGVDANSTITRSALTTAVGTRYPAFAAINGGQLPRIAQLFDMDATGTATERHGVYVSGAGSSGIIEPGAGVANAGGHGVYALNSATADAAGAIFSGAGAYGIHAKHSSSINAEGADASGGGVYGMYAMYSSSINAEGADASGASSTCLYARSGSIINAGGADASGGGSFGIYAYMATINAQNANASGAGVTGIYARDGSIISAASATGTTNITPNTLTSSGIIFQ